MVKKIRNDNELKDKFIINYAISSFRGAINLYFYYLRRGFPEKKCINIAVNYVWGQISSSGVLSDPIRRKKFLYSLKAIKGMMEAVISQIEAWYGDKG